MQLDTLKTGIFKLNEFTNFIIVRRNILLNKLCSFVSPNFRFKETLSGNVFTDPKLSSSLYLTKSIHLDVVYVFVARLCVGNNRTVRRLAYNFPMHLEAEGYFSPPQHSCLHDYNRLLKSSKSFSICLSEDVDGSLILHWW